MGRFTELVFVSVVFVLMTVAPINVAVAEQQKSLALSLNIYVFPSEGQETSQQSKPADPPYEEGGRRAMKHVCTNAQQHFSKQEKKQSFVVDRRIFRLVYGVSS
jgi:hypothetical protein